jgi:DNA-binding NarL/FixJ family response regulator
MKSKLQFQPREMKMSISPNGQELLIHIPLTLTREFFVPKPRHENGMIDMTALTCREKDTIKKVIEGKSNKEIANELNLSVRTVKFHVTSLLRKCWVSSRYDLQNLARSVASQ